MANDVLEAWVMCHLPASAWMHYGVVRHWGSSLLLAARIVAHSVVIIVIVAAALVREVLRSFVFVCTAILSPISLLPTIDRCSWLSLHIGSGR